MALPKILILYFNRLALFNETATKFMAEKRVYFCMTIGILCVGHNAWYCVDRNEMSLMAR